jgi:antirestriction protein
MTVQVYVGTYGKYNDGSIAGAWVSLDEHDTEAAFYAAAKALHKNEHDPELMFQDFEGFPQEFYGESYLDERLWEWLELDDDDRETVSGWLEVGDGTESIPEILESYRGCWESWTHFVYDYIENTGLLDGVSERVTFYFDYESFGRDLAMEYRTADAESFGLLVYKS